MSVSLLALLLAAQTTAAQPPRRAVLVGSNSAVAGRAALKFSHGDVKNMASVLTANGGFAAQDVVQLFDPTPDEVMAELERAASALKSAGADGMLLFYYSGHADQQALFPGGQPLALATLRGRLVDPSGVRIGIIDACRGGGWTQAKGLSPVGGFSVGPSPLGSEGLALIAASSGLEEAHEAEQLRGSFFTHHFVAGLRGAADATGDGHVTLNEAFSYANERTIRDTATRAREPQHPSYDFRLHGRQDVVLASLSSGSTALVLSQTAGPLEVVQLSTGVTVVEATPGAQVLRLSLPPGSYLVRRFEDGRVLSREVRVTLNSETKVEESSLTLVGAQSTGVKGASDGAAHFQFGLAAGTLSDLEAGAAQLASGLELLARIEERLAVVMELLFLYTFQDIEGVSQPGLASSLLLRFDLVQARITPYVAAGVRGRFMLETRDRLFRTLLTPLAQVGVEYVHPSVFPGGSARMAIGLRGEGGVQLSVRENQTAVAAPAFGGMLTFGALF